MNYKLFQEYDDREHQYETTELTKPSSFQRRIELDRAEDETVYLGQFSRFSKTQQRGFDLGPFGLILEPAALYEIIESAKISPMPGTNNIFKGLVNHRSNVAPVYDINKLIDDETDASSAWERKRLLILGTGNEAVAIVIYNLPIQLKSDYRVHPEDMEKVPAIFRKHTQCAYLNNEKLWLKIDYQALFNELTAINSTHEQAPTI